MFLHCRIVNIFYLCTNSVYRETMREILKSKARRIELMVALFLFILEGIIYLTFRSTELNMFRLYGRYDWVDSLRIYGESYSDLFPYWTKYSLPDGLWLFSYLLLIDAIWNRFDKSSWVWYLLMPAVAFGSELLQFVMKESFTPWNTGTYDTMDVVCYTFAVVFIVMIYIFKFRIREKLATNAEKIH